MPVTETLTPTEAAPASNPSEASNPPLSLVEPKLWAGKYKSVDELEAAYKNSAVVFDENVRLKKDLERHQIPSDYTVPDTLQMRAAELAELKLIAKNAGLTQEQFMKTATDMQNRMQGQLHAFEEARKAVGEANMNVLTDYVSKHYPERLREHVMNKLIQDKEAMQDALKHRETLLHTGAPGMDKANPGTPEKYDGEKELVEAAKAYHKNPRDKEAQKKYVALAAAVGEARYKKD